MAFFTNFVPIVVILSVTTASIIKEDENKHHGAEYHGEHNPNFPNAKAAQDVESRQEKDHSGSYYHSVHNPNYPKPSVEDLEVKENDYTNDPYYHGDHNPNFPVSSAENFNSKEIKDHHHHGPNYHGPHNPNFPLNSEEADKRPPHNGHESESHSNEHNHHGFNHKFPFFGLPFLKPHDENNNESGFNFPNFPWFPNPNFKPDDNKIMIDAELSSQNSDERPNQLIPNFDQEVPRDQE